MPENNSTYFPFARKYRPQKFSELMGQEVLVKTLTYCILNDHLAGAFLFTGIRGVGKTSSARIVAKTVNCTDLQTEDKQIYPCDNCKNCEGFKNSNHPDIIEIDAASKTSVDDVREIIESSVYAPLIGKKKFFIIDEIHMLSKSAFNALLKIVEEPPEHVVFIFATTEVQKIPLTVISRCQRYDLRRLSFEEIYTLLKNISKKENINVEDDALKIIAIKSEGSARDAVVIFDQASSYIHSTDSSSTGLITSEIINKMLGLIRSSTIVKFVQLIIANNPKDAIDLLQEIYKNSSNLEYFVGAIADFLAELSKAKVIPNYHNPLYKNHDTEITNILIGTNLGRLSILWQIFSNGTHEMKQSHNELVTAQMLIIKAIYSCNLPSIEELQSSDNSTISNTTVSSSDSQNNVSDDIYNFLKYCFSKKEMNIYYTLLNDVEVKEFAKEKMSIAGSNIDVSSKKVESLLSDWSGKDWNVTATKQDKVASLRQKLHKKAEQAEDYQLIKKNFPDADISDIVLGSKYEDH
ncbi:DNA polymerase III subunit gamma/tau [Rickettsiaceae bacterium]|nr:DNA polymerase III subunit gamma/tau [Rickettsiaceae bacterium]